MDKEITNLKILLVDDEADFRQATSKTLNRRGFIVSEAESGDQALERLKIERPDIILLDLKMPGRDGIETLMEIRKKDPTLPVIILTGHGDFDAAVAGIKLDIVDFLQKPVDVDQLGIRIHNLMTKGGRHRLQERPISDLMVSPDLYPKLFVDEPISAAMEAMRKAFYQPVSEGLHPGQVRSALIYERNNKFLAIIRLNDILKLILPAFLENSPYSTYFTGMFLAQCKVIGNRSIRELTGSQIAVEGDAPLMEAVHLMVQHHLINIPVMKNGELVGILRGRDIVLEIADSLGSL